MKRQTANRRRDATVSGYTLPLVIDPPETICVCVPVPDDPYHRAAFLGQMLALSRWYTWARDDAHLGKDAAAVWENIWVIVRDEMALQARNCGCGCSDNRQERLNADGTISISTDGGATWTPATASQDPRTSGSYTPPIDAADADGKCAGANSAVAYYKQKQAETFQQMTDGATAAELATLLIGFLVAIGVIATGGALAVFLAAIGSVLAGLDVTAWNALFTDELWAALLCKIYCAMDDTGLVTEADALTIAAEMKTEFPNRAGEFIYALLTGSGQVGLTNAIRAGLDGALSCDDCEPCNPSCSDNWTADVGTYIGTFDGYKRFQSAVVGGTSILSIITPTVDDCCKLIDVRYPLNELTIVAKYHIGCGSERIEPNLVSNWNLEICPNFMTSQAANGDPTTYQVEFLFADCD